MNQRKTNQRVAPLRVIIVYGTNKDYSNDYYLETRDIKKQGDRYAMMAPVPCTPSMFKDLVKSMSQSQFPEMEFTGLISETMLYGFNKGGRTVVMWYKPAVLRSLNFSASLPIKGDTAVRVPATLYVVVDKKLYLFALMTDKRPDENTKLYHAPFFNIYSDGNVCLGTAPVGRDKGKTFEQEAERFERAFYMAEQSGGGENQCKTALKPLWQRLIKKPQPFPSKVELKQHTKFKTVGDIFRNLIFSKNG